MLLFIISKNFIGIGLPSKTITGKQILSLFDDFSSWFLTIISHRKQIKCKKFEKAAALRDEIAKLREL
jgi:hypothetical protein